MMRGLLAINKHNTYRLLNDLGLVNLPTWVDIHCMRKLP